MSFRVCKAGIYEFQDTQGKVTPDYIILNNYDGRFLEWIDVQPTGIPVVDENIGLDGSVVVHEASHAEAIIEKL